MQKRHVDLKQTQDQFRQKRKKTVLVKSVLVFILFLILVIGATVLSRMQRFAITEVVVSGNQVLETTKIQSTVLDSLQGNYLFLFAKRNFLLYPRNGIEEKLTVQFPRILDMSVSRKGFHTIAITLHERNSASVWCVGEKPQTEVALFDNCYFFDDNGYIFAQAPVFSGNIFFKLYGGDVDDTPIGKTIMDSDELHKILLFKDGADFLNPDSLLIKAVGDYELYLPPQDASNVHPKILWNTKQPVDTMIDNLNSALNTDPLKTGFKTNFNKLLYIDLRFANKVFYKFETGA